MDSEKLLPKFRTFVQESEVSNFNFSDEVLMCFIYARKNDLKRALSLLKNFVKMTQNYPDLMTNLQQRDLQHLLDLGHHLVSPRREQNGCRIFILKATHWESETCSLEEVFRGIVFCFQLMTSEEDTQRRGIVVIIDMKDFGLRQVRNVTPSFLKKLADLANGVFPLRFHGIHIVFEPWVFKMIMSMIWPLLSSKIRSRVIVAPMIFNSLSSYESVVNTVMQLKRRGLTSELMFFHGYNMETLHEQVDPASLPNDYEGWLGPASEMICTNVINEKNCINIFSCFDS